MKIGRILIGIVLLAGVGSLILLRPNAPSRANTQRSPSSLDNHVNGGNGIQIGEAVTPTLTVAARDLPPFTLQPALDREINPRLDPYGRTDIGRSLPGGLDPLLAVQAAASNPTDPAFDTPILNFDGQPYGFVNPPDTVGDVGTQYYVQMVNSTSGAIVAIYDKTTGAEMQTFLLEGLASGGACSAGLGDPIVLFDHAANRWFLSEFASAGSHLCIYVSQTADPTGAYYAYDFTTPGFPDYPKYAVWPDAYYVSTNESAPAVYALDRLAMLAGATASSQRFTATPLTGFAFQALTPGDWDGAATPPGGAPGYFMRHRDTEAHGPSGFPTADFLEIWAFAVDWGTPGNSTFTKIADIAIAEFDSDLCGLLSFACIAQPAAPLLDPLREVIMWRLQYRNFGNYETLVGNFVTDVNGADKAGIRWFELRKSDGGAWSLYQEGTYSPDNGAINRWMGASAMDGSGNIALAYNVSNSSTVYPGLRYAGRLATDAAGTLPQGEYTIVNGSDTNGSNRYGDYAAMSVDPVDDCTFWFTGEYNVALGWSTRIATFRFDDCGVVGDFTLAAQPTSQAVCVTDSADYTIDVTAVNGLTDSIDLTAVGNPGTATFVPTTVIPDGSSTLTISGAPSGNFTFDVVGTNSSDSTHTHSVVLGLDVYAPLASAVTLLSPVDGALQTALQPTFTWATAAGATSYLIEIATEPTFAAPVDTANVATTSYTPVTTLANNTTYYWRVTPINVCGTGPAAAAFSFHTLSSDALCAPGQLTQTVYFDNFESGAPGWTHGSLAGDDTWHLLNGSGIGGSTAFHADDIQFFVNEQYLLSPAIMLPVNEAPLTLQFFNRQEIEASPTGCYDGGLLEISADSGTTWTQIDAELLTDPYDGVISADDGNPLGGLNGWCGDPQDWINAVVDLNAYAGDTVQFRFQYGTDGVAPRDGWDIDNVLVQSCIEPATYEIYLPTIVKP